MFKRKLYDAEAEKLTEPSLPTKRQKRASEIQVQLLDKDLWDEFHALTNEMIVTKIGRRMFPVIRVNVEGLDPDEMYRVSLRFKGTSAHRWRFVNGQWRSNQNGQIAASKNTAYEHRYSPNFGRFWTNSPISFTTLRLTNRQQDDKPCTDKISLNTLHKYTPELLITKVEAKSEVRVAEVSFPSAEFIAVTAYQNEKITALKIRHNPFAKAFLNINDRAIRSSNRRERREESIADKTICSYQPEPQSDGVYLPVGINSHGESYRKTSAINWPYLPCADQSTFVYPSIMNEYNFDTPMHQPQMSCYLRSINNITGQLSHLDSSYFDSCYASQASICDQQF